KALQLEPHDTKNIDNTQDLWKIFEKNVVASGQALEYNLNDRLSDK
ncbi:42608_t:CDS:1, partial [Gigaspora margarita]